MLVLAATSESEGVSLSRELAMSDHYEVQLLQSDLDRAHDWSKFVYDTFFKFYAAYLALNIAALGFVDQFDKSKWVAGTFVVADFIGVVMALVITVWTSQIRKRISDWHSELAALAGTSSKAKEVFPSLPAYFALTASALTQLGFTIVWIVVALSE